VTSSPSPAIEAAARALFERDMARSVGLDSAARVWERVAPEYRAAARVALLAAAGTRLDGAHG